MEAFRRKASGYLLKDSAASDLAAAIHEALRGGHYMSAKIADQMPSDWMKALDEETVLGVPTIGLVPSQGSLGGRRIARQRRLAATNGSGSEAPFALVAHNENESVMSEAFRNLRTSLLYSSPDHPPKTVMITSLQPEDGKTSTATNSGALRPTSRSLFCGGRSPSLPPLCCRR